MTVCQSKLKEVEADPVAIANGRPRTIEWVGGLDGLVRMIDQTRLPGELVQLELRDVESLWQAIRRLSVRGAPAIGVAAAMGVVLGTRRFRGDRAGFDAELEKICGYLASARPTAVNLSWALERMKRRAGEFKTEPISAVLSALLQEAKAIRDEDAAVCLRIGEVGQHLVADGGGVLTHCNAGALAAAEHGTALSVLYAAWRADRRFRVYAGETRPLLQGARLTAWELQRAGIPVTVICDSMAAAAMRKRMIDLVIVGADRIAANGDTANKIGTYGLAVLARAHGVPFYVAAPRSTFDMSLPEGGGIPIEERDGGEVHSGMGPRTAPDGVPCWNPAFDVTPAELITGIVTECGIIQPVTAARIRQVLSS